MTQWRIYTDHIRTHTAAEELIDVLYRHHHIGTGVGKGAHEDVLAQDKSGDDLHEKVPHKCVDDDGRKANTTAPS